MTLRHMIIFRTVCEANFNITKAAELLHNCGNNII